MIAGNRWQLATTAEFDKSFRKLDKPVQKRVLAYLVDVTDLPDPRQRGKALTADRSGTWRYRIGDYRVIAVFDDVKLIVIALSVGHRSTIY